MKAFRIFLCVVAAICLIAIVTVTVTLIIDYNELASTPDVTDADFLMFGMRYGFDMFVLSVLGGVACYSGYKASKKEPQSKVFKIISLSGLWLYVATAIAALFVFSM